MRINIPAGAFRKAAARKRKDQSSGAEGPSKRPRPQSPPAPQNTPSLPLMLPRQSPLAAPPQSESSPAPPPQSKSPPAPPPQSRQSLPSSPSSAPAGPSTSLPSEGLLAPVIDSAGPSTTPSAASIPRDTPRTEERAPVDRRLKAPVGREASAAAPEPAGDRVKPIPSRPSVMNHPYLAEKLLSSASTSAIQEEIRRTSPQVLFKDCQTALLRVVNVFNHTQAMAAHGERRISRYRREALECREQAANAEIALKLSSAGEAERLEVVRSHARAESEALRQQANKTLERALAAEGSLMASEAELANIKAQLEAMKSELKSAEEKTEIAEEVARLADIKAAEAMEAVKAADRKSAEIKAAARAAEEEAASAVEKAVESYRNSAAFVEEVAEAGAGAYLQGFYDCRDKAVKVFGTEGLKDLEPDEDLDNEVIAPDPVLGDGAILAADEDASRNDAAPAEA